MSDSRSETGVPVRVRLAPSPTGDPHVGTAYQALVNLAFARSRGGVFVLRIEDTDRERSSRRAEAAILEALRWLGLEWDEGPYRQSERLDLYRREVDRLLASGDAYRCFCTRERLDEMRRELRAQQRFPGYDRRCRSLPRAESERRAAAGEEHVVRAAMPVEGECVMQDLLRGEIRREWELVDDQVILKADGYPTYHLACVVDDHAMGISHVIRGEEWINSLPKHLRLMEALGYEPPTFCHLPLLRNNDANRSKLSKRRNPTSVTWFRDAGFLPEALRNFLGLLVSSRAEGEEKFTLAELVDGFRLEDISLGGPVFDLEKLRWLNARYLREDYDAAGLAALIREWSMQPERLERIAALAQPRLLTLGDWGRWTNFLFVDTPQPSREDLAVPGMTAPETANLLQLVLWSLEREDHFEASALLLRFRELSAALELPMRKLTRPFYVAISGEPSSLPLFQSMEILGPDLVRARIRAAIEVLGGIGGKRRKKLEKRFRALGL